VSLKNAKLVKKNARGKKHCVVPLKAGGFSRLGDLKCKIHRLQHGWQKTKQDCHGNRLLHFKSLSV